jgi:hypothetical protein
VSTVAAIAQRLAGERFEAALGKELAVRPQAVVADQPRGPLAWGEVRARHAQRTWWRRRYDHLRAVITLRLIRSAHTSRGQTWRLIRNTTASVMAAAALLYVGWQSW